MATITQTRLPYTLAIVQRSNRQNRMRRLEGRIREALDRDPLACRLEEMEVAERLGANRRDPGDFDFDN